MSIRIKFRSAVNFDTVDIEGRSSISVGELREKIIRYKKLNVCQDFDLVFSDAASGQEFDDPSTQIPSGSSVIIKRIPAGRNPSAIQPISAVGKHGVKDSHPSKQVNDRMDGINDLGANLCSVPDAILPGPAPEFDKKKCGSSEKENVADLRIKGSKLSSSDPNQDTSRGCNFSWDKEKTEERMISEKLSAPDYAPTEINGLPSELKCSLCNTYFKEAVMIPCCQHSFCDKCIRPVLIEKATCPKCSSNKCKVKDLLPNLSLRQAIKHFLASQMLTDCPENDLCKYAPDGESGIQVKEDSCAVTILQREPELPHSPSLTGKGSNQVVPESFYSSDIRNASFGASHKRINAGGEISSSVRQTVKDIHKEIGVYTHQDNLQNGPNLDLTADCQGENTLLDLPYSHVHDEAYSTGKRKRGLLIEIEGADRNLVAAGRPNKVIRTCYLCGSPDHLIRDCPAGSGPNPILQTEPGMPRGGFPGYASSYWNGAMLPPARPFANLYTNPGMVPFNATAVPMMQYGAPLYVPSTYAALPPPPGGIMRMGTMAPRIENGVPCPFSHPKHLAPRYCERPAKLSDEEPHRGQNRDDEDYIDEHYHYREPERPPECTIRKEREASASHSGDSFAQRSHKHQPGRHIGSDAYTVDAKLEKRSRSSLVGKDQKPYSKREDSGMQHIPNTANKNGELRHKHCHKSSRKNHEKRGQSPSDSTHGRHHHSERDDARWRVEDNVRSPHRKRNNHSDSALKPSSPGERRKQHKYRDSGVGSGHPRQSMKRACEHHDRWKTINDSEDDYRGDYCHHKRKTIH